PVPLATAPARPLADATPSASELWAMVSGPTAAPAFEAPLMAEPANDGPAGLTKRVRGAQLPDLGVNSIDEPLTVERPPEQVRSSLSSLQRGLDLGRQATTDSPSEH